MEAIYNIDPLICELDCYTSDEWKIKEEKVPYPNCPGCTLTVSFRYRDIIGYDCPDNYKDYYINYFESPVECTDQCGNWSEYYYYIVDWLIKNGPNQSPPPGFCENFYRIISPICWRQTTLYGRRIFAACKDAACCWSQWRVCDTNGVKTKEWLQGSSASANCPDPSCWSLCATIPTKVNLPSGVNELDNHVKFFSSVIPNPSTDVIELKISSEYIGWFTLSIFDDKSNLVYRKKNNKLSQEQSINIDFTNFPTGIYFYNIRISEKMIDFGKFSFVK